MADVNNNKNPGQIDLIIHQSKCVMQKAGIPSYVEDLQIASFKKLKNQLYLNQSNGKNHNLKTYPQQAQ